MSSLKDLVTSLYKITESRDHPLCALVTSCLIAVRKPITGEILIKTNVNEFKFHNFSRARNHSLIFPEAVGICDTYDWFITFINIVKQINVTSNSTETDEKTNNNYTLWIEESCHPEAIRSSFEYPLEELVVSFQ